MLSTCRQIHNEAHSLFILSTHLDEHWSRAKSQLQQLGKGNKGDSDEVVVVYVFIEDEEKLCCVRVGLDGKIPGLLDLEAF